MPASKASSCPTLNHEPGNFPRTTALLTAVKPTPRRDAKLLRPTESANSEEVIMDAIYPHLVDEYNSTICGLHKNPPLVDYANMANHDYPYEEIGSRLEAMRTAYSDLKQRQWAEKHGFNPTQYNNWAKGGRRITVEAAERLCDTYGVTLDFIYRGRRDGLSETASKAL